MLSGIADKLYLSGDITDPTEFENFINGLDIVGSGPAVQLVAKDSFQIPEYLSGGGTLMMISDNTESPAVNVAAGKRPAASLGAAGRPSATSHPTALRAFRNNDLKEWATHWLNKAGRAGELSAGATPKRPKTNMAVISSPTTSELQMELERYKNMPVLAAIQAKLATSNSIITYYMQSKIGAAVALTLMVLLNKEVGKARAKLIVWAQRLMRARIPIAKLRLLLATIVLHLARTISGSKQFAKP